MTSAAPPPANFYATPELASHYDADQGERDDFAFYLDLAARLDLRRVVDLGAGTGLLASRLGAAGHEVLGLDPQATMLDLAAAQPHAASVTWVHGFADRLPTSWADLVVMTGHVAQYFPDDASWAEVLRHARRALGAGGYLAFEIRNDAVEAWRGWASTEPQPTQSGTIETTVERRGDLVTHVSRWESGGRSWATTETLRFPPWSAVAAGLDDAGFEIVERWGDFAGGPVAPQSPEWITLARPRPAVGPAPRGRGRAPSSVPRPL